MTFIDVYTADQINQLTSHGLVGLSPTSASGKYITIIQEMYDRGLIEKNMFSLHLGLKEHESKMVRQSPVPFTNKSVGGRREDKIQAQALIVLFP